MNLRFYYKKELIIYANFSYFGGKIDLTNHLTTRKITKKPKIKCIGNYELISMDLVNHHVVGAFRIPILVRPFSVIL